MIRSLLFWNIFPLAPTLLKTLIACQQRKIKNQSTTSERFNMCHIERASTAYSHVIASPANCTISLSVWNVFLWNISQLRAEVLCNTLIYSPGMPEFCTSPVSLPAASLPCLGQVRGEGPLGDPAPSGERNEREKSEQFKHEIKNKSILSDKPPLFPPLKSRSFSLPFEASSSPWHYRPLFPFPSAAGTCCSCQTSSPWKLPSCPGLPSLARPSLLSPGPQEAVPSNHQSFVYGSPLEKGWIFHILPTVTWRSR